ncbi:MAG: 2'-deoxycytidine 5'-triphosphate deaminase [Terriglobia bacterium]
MGIEKKSRHPEQRAGILPSQFIRELIDAKRIMAINPVEDAQIQPASIDVRLGPIAYRVRASFLPGKNSTVEAKLQSLALTEVDLVREAVFETGCVYVVPLMEELALAEDLAAKANPKSTTGRLDIFTRLLTDGGEEFERVPRGYRGKLYAEIVSRTFPVAVKEGMSLNQLRFVRKRERMSDKMLTSLDRQEGLVYKGEDVAARANIQQGLWISLDLQGESENSVVALKARKNAPVIHLNKVGFYEPDEFWEPIRRRPDRAIILDADDFYLLASKEKIRVPPSVAAEMVPFDPAVGEFRIHYAGFFDPGFGYGNSDIRGTKAVLEVRAHETAIFMEDDQKVGRLIYSELMAVPSKLYGPSIGSSYQQQGLALSKQFKRL